MFYIRVDGNSKIGTGHIMRCLSIARAMAGNKIETAFLLAEEDMAPVVQAAGFHAIILHTDYRDMEREIPQLCQWLGQGGHFILVDSYQVTAAYLKKLRNFGKVAYLDDLNLFPYPVDYLINYNVYADSFQYQAKADGIARKLFLSCGFTPLRDEFLNVPYQVREKAEKILITTGGGDLCHLAAQILRHAFCNGNERYEFHVVCGRFCGDLTELSKLQEGRPMLFIHQNVKNMAALMQQCDLCLTAGGTTVYELCAIGLPFLCFAFVENQKRMINSFKELGIVFESGDYLLQGGQIIPELWKAAETLLGDYEMRKRFSEKGRKLVDGYGAKRIADAFLHEMNQKNG